MAVTTSESESASAAHPKIPQILVLTPGKEQLPVQFSFDDTSLTHKDASRSTCTYHTASLSRVVTDTHPICSPDVQVPLSHVLSVDVSDSVVDAHVLENTRNGLNLVKLSGSFQGDNAEASSAANDWVQGAMSAAYPGALRTPRPCLSHITSFARRKVTTALLDFCQPPLWPREPLISACLLYLVLTVDIKL